MNQAQFEADVSAEIRAAIAPENRQIPVDSPLYTSLLKGGWRHQRYLILKLKQSPEIYEGRCTECGNLTEDYDDDNEDFCCRGCRMDVVAGQERDKFLDDPRRG